jgi:hypothetical protein
MTREELLKKVASGEVKPEEALALFGATPNPKAISCRVSRKGAISVYGLQQMPVTLYVEQWERFFAWACPDVPFAQTEVGKFAAQWEGKDFHGESAESRGGKKTPYTARITRKAA